MKDSMLRSMPLPMILSMKRQPRSIYCLLVSILVMTFAQASYSQSLKQLFLMPGELSESHSDVESKCESCHIEFDKSGQTRLCLDCHEDIDKDITASKGFHGLNNKIRQSECNSCHTDHKGRSFDIVGLDSDTFDHDSSNFPLVGRHKGKVCGDCHRNEHSYRLESYACFDCHGSSSPHPKERNEDCQSCHTSESWADRKFLHGETDFPLRHKHQDVDCRSCHVNDRYKDVGMSCADCHALDDTHKNRFGNQCEDCHSERGWQTSFFKHNKDTQFTLEHKHADLSCESCHLLSASRQVLDANKDCVSCHKKDDAHGGGNGDECQSCHDSKDWKSVLFDHSKDTDYPLLGKHLLTNCNACHSLNGKAVKKPERSCDACHGQSDPHDRSLGLQCQQCHSPSAWRDTVFTHDLTDFPLVGMHRQLTCQECHVDADYASTESQCIQCHRRDDEHNRALGQNCELCHNPNDWSMWLFDHDKKTGFHLRGGHKDLQCQLCHRQGVVVSSQCGSCHRDDDPHRGGFGRQCQQCHDVTSFSR